MRMMTDEFYRMVKNDLGIVERRIVAVKLLDDITLEVKFDTGECRYMDADTVYDYSVSSVYYEHFKYDEE